MKPINSSRGPRVSSPKLREAHAHKRKAALKSLRADYSTGQISRAYDIPQHLVSAWRDEAGIPAYTGKPRRMPQVGDILT